MVIGNATSGYLNDSAKEAVASNLGATLNFFSGANTGEVFSGIKPWLYEVI